MNQPKTKELPFTGVFHLVEKDDGWREGLLLVWAPREQVRELDRAGQVKVRVTFELTLDLVVDEPPRIMAGGRVSTIYRMKQCDQSAVGDFLAGLSDRSTQVEVAFVSGGSGRWYSLKLYDNKEGTDEPEK